VVVLDLRGISDVTDWFVICHGTSDRQVRAIADAIEERLGRSLRSKPVHVEGRRTCEWVLMDYIDFVVHVFLEDKREFYRLERLWGDAPRVDVSGFGPVPDRRSSRSG
jgi:ribosome-associated protein